MTQQNPEYSEKEKSDQADNNNGSPEGNEEQKENLQPSQEGDDPKDAPKEDPKDQPKQKYSKRERLLYAKGKIENELDELENEEDDDRPLTVGELKRIRKEEARDLALEMAEDIDDEDERQQVIDVLRNRITPSGNPDQDLALARGAVNSLKNQQILEENARRGTPRRYATTPGAPGQPADRFEPTAEESVFMRPPYNLSKDQILKAREAAEARRQG